jgi:uncharacterized protein (DUF342 family)
MTKEQIIALLKSKKRGKLMVLILSFEEEAKKLNPVELKMYIENKYMFDDSEKNLIKNQTLKVAMNTYFKRTDKSKNKSDQEKTPLNDIKAKYVFKNVDDLEDNSKLKFFK